MNVLYVCVSGPEDTYYEQMIVSLMSLERAMPDAHAIVLADQDTYDGFRGRRERIFHMGADVRRITVPDGYGKKERSRYLKTSMNRYVDGSFLYIDSDTVVCERLDDAEAFGPGIGAVLDCHVRVSGHPLKDMMEKTAATCGFHAAYEDCHFNSGVMWVGKDSDEFFELWHTLWKEGMEAGVSYDQPSLNEANFRLGGVIAEMAGTWNCHLSRYGSGLPYLLSAKILHYFASNREGTVGYDLSDNALLRTALDEPANPAIGRILDDPKAALHGYRLIISDPIDFELAESRTFLCLHYLAEHARPLYRAMDAAEKLVMDVARAVRNFGKPKKKGRR